MDDNSSRLVEMKLVVDDMLKEVEHYLRGEVWDGVQKKFIQVHKSYMNNEGVSTLITELYVYSNARLMGLGKIDDIMLHRMAEDIERNIAFIIFQKCNEFDLDKTYADSVVDMIGNIAFVQIGRSVGGFEQDKLEATNKVVEHHTNTINQQGSSGGMLDKFNPFRKN